MRYGMGFEQVNLTAWRSGTCTGRNVGTSVSASSFAYNSKTSRPFQNSTFFAHACRLVLVS